MVTRSKATFTETIAPHPQTPAELEHRIRSLSLTDALIAVEWLNAAKGTMARARVLDIRTQLEYVGAMLDSLPKGLSGPKLNELRIRHNALNVDLSRYTFCPVMAYDLSSGVWRYNAIPQNARGREIEVTHQGVTVRVDEAAVVAAFARLAANRELHKVRLCEQCKENWRVSERQIDRFCSQQCREAHYRAQPEFKTRRKKIQKDYRSNQKRKDAKALADVRLSGRS